MKKVVIYGVAIAFLCVAGFTGMSFAEDKGAENYTLSTEQGKKPAIFPHAAHQARTECDKCHKDANYTPAAWTKDSGHKLCKDCHKASKAPTKCGVCHPKKK